MPSGKVLGLRATIRQGRGSGKKSGYGTEERAMNQINPKVERFLQEETHWRKEFEKLRGIILDLGLEEDLKWGKPCYSSGGKNIVLIHGFKEYCAVLFFNGALLKDPKGILIQQTENVQAARQVRFTSLDEVEELEPALKVYIREAVEAEKSGKKVELKKTAEYKVAEEFQKELDNNPALKTAFGKLTPGRQRAYLMYFSMPKTSKTREERVKKYRQHILNGKGLGDE